MRAAWAIPCLFLTAACARDAGPAPTLTQVAPNTGELTAATAVRVLGEGFQPLVRVDLDDAEQVQVQDVFRLELQRTEQRHPIGNVVRVSANELMAEVPAGLPAGSYSLRLVDPRGREAFLATAFTVLATRCGPSACVIDRACVAAGTLRPGNTCEACVPTVATNRWTVVPDGSPCVDGDDCSQGETCSAGVCGAPTHLGPCTADLCHGAGWCHPVTRKCPAPRPNGTPCDDQNACTLGESCQDGWCGQPGVLVQCSATACRPAGVCEPATGQCVHPPGPDGAACDDQNLCTQSDTCGANGCRGQPACGNTAPRACLAVSPAAGASGTTFHFDATCSSDAEELPAALAARFDFDGDGTFDSAFSPSLTATHTFAATGAFRAVVELKDPSGLTSWAARTVWVSAAADEVVVDTVADESDPNATPAAPGGAGLSLREAILYVNGANAPKVIRFARPMRLVLGALPPLQPAGAAIVGGDGPVLDFSASNGGSCLTLAGANQALVAVEALGCPGVLVHVTGQSVAIVDSRLSGGGAGLQGVRVSGALARVGPGNVLSGFAGSAVVVRAAQAAVDGNRLRENQVAVELQNGADQTLVQRNRLHRNGTGVSGNRAQSPALRHNTFHATTQSAIQLTGSVNAASIRNNIVVGSGARALDAPPPALAETSPNLSFGNAQASALEQGPNLTADPLLLGPAAEDFRLAPTSPALNAGVDSGLDLNGPSGGNFNGSAPDLGAEEMP